MVSKAAFFALPIFALVLLTSPSQASNAGQAGFELPQPNGCHPVGTRTVVLRDPHRSRDLLVTMWYPAVEGTSALAPYMDRRLRMRWPKSGNCNRISKASHARKTPGPHR